MPSEGAPSTSTSVGDGASAPSPEPTRPGTAHTTLPTPTPTLPTTTTIPEPLVAIEPSAPVLISNDDGVFQLGTDGVVIQLIDGPVAFAIDDTRGGLVFQVDRGRNFEATTGWSTAVWWIPAGSTDAAELIVPTPGQDHQLSLHDAYRTSAGFSILYTRHERGATVWELEDTLRVFHMPSRTVETLISHGAYEEGFGEVSSVGSTISGVRYDQVSSVCFMLGHTGQEIPLPAAVREDPVRLEYIVRGCHLTADETQIIYATDNHDDGWSSILHVLTLADGTEVTHELTAGGGLITGLDVAFGDVLLGPETDRPHYWSSLAGHGASVPLPLTGIARFAKSPVAIGTISPTP